MELDELFARRHYGRGVHATKAHLESGHSKVAPDLQRRQTDMVLPSAVQPNGVGESRQGLRSPSKRRGGRPRRSHPSGARPDRSDGGGCQLRRWLSSAGHVTCPRHCCSRPRVTLSVHATWPGTSGPDATAFQREGTSAVPLIFGDLDALLPSAPIAEKWVDKLRAYAEQLRTARSQIACENTELWTALSQKEELLQEGLRRQNVEQAVLEELRRQQLDREARLQEMQVQAQLQSVEEGLRTAQDKVTNCTGGTGEKLGREGDDQGAERFRSFRCWPRRPKRRKCHLGPRATVSLRCFGNRPKWTWEACVVGPARCWRRGGLTHAGSPLPLPGDAARMNWKFGVKGERGKPR